jgi:hypothetical protein
MILPIVTWYFQDLLQVLFPGSLVVPDMFFIVLAYRVASPARDVHEIIWPAFAGGLLWDLRWTALPGMTAAIYAFSLTLCIIAWNRIPDSGRNPRLFFLIAAGGHILIGIIRIIATGENAGSFAGSLAVQQVIALPLLLVAAMILSSRMTDSDVRR